MRILRHGFARWLNDYGMALVLIGLCAYYTAVTIQDVQPAGAEAARQLMDQVRTQPGLNRILVVVKNTAEDRVFLAVLEPTLKQGGKTVHVAQGEPRDARLVLEKLDRESTPLDAIATTSECASWTLLQTVTERFPRIGRPILLNPVAHRWPTFLTRQNLLNIANQIAVVAILAVGMTVVILTGGIDLSVGSLIALSAVVVTVLIRDHAGGIAAAPFAMVICSLGGISLCALAGLFSGFVVAGFKVPPFIATLAVMQVASGAAFIIAKGASVYEVPDSFTWIGRSVGWSGIPRAVLLMLALYLGAHLMMTRTVLGRLIYAVGGNAVATRLSGVKVGRVVVFAYLFCGAMAGVGGVVLASQLKSGAPTYGLMYELYAIAAVVVGGTSLSGGEGRIVGTLIGALIIAVIQNGMNLTGIESYRQKVILGLVILGAVLVDQLKRRDWRDTFARLLKIAR